MFRGTSNFDKSLEKATSNLLLEPDWNTILTLCDCIRQGDVQPKYALSALKKKLFAQNPRVVLYALQVLESWVKNCGSPIHQEVGTKQFMEELKDLAKVSTNESVKSKILELIQTWAFAFRNEPNYRAMQDTLNLMKIEGHAFPVLKETDAMFVADTAPEWVDGDCCHRCRTQFGVVQRKHHCRNCGQVFCAKCSSKNLSIPRIGFEKEVRVCDSCYDALSKPLGGAKPGETELPQEYLASSLSQQAQVPPTKSEQEIQEEEDLQLALALSKSDAENKEKEKLRATNSMLSTFGVSNPNATVSSAPSLDSSLDSDSPELSRYLNRNYWEQKQLDVIVGGGGGGSVGSPRAVESGGHHLGEMVMVNSLGGGPIPSAPTSGASSVAHLAAAMPILHTIKVEDEHHHNGDVEELDEFVAALRGSLEIFVNRMKSNSSRGRSIAVDSTVQTFFMNITAMHSQLLRFMQEQDDRRVYFEGLQDKLSQAKDARAALDALREEHRERMRREAEEAERVRQIQMAHKLEIMRKKKQEYLQYQRQIAMQRMQEQEREMQLRQEQQKQQYMRHAAELATGGPQAYASPPPSHAGFSPPNVNESPVHHQRHAYQPQYHFQAQSPYQPPPQGPQPEFAQYNMQGVAGSLPPVLQSPYAQHLQQQQVQPAPQNSSIPGHVNVAAPNGPPVGPMQGPAVPQPNNPLEAELISFD